MQLGMFMQPVHDPKRNYTQVLEEDRETIILADKLGFAEVWVEEHISATAEPITAPLVFLESLIEQTKNIKLGTGVFCLPLQHPAIIAGQAAMFRPHEQRPVSDGNRYRRVGLGCRAIRRRRNYRPRRNGSRVH